MYIYLGIIRSTVDNKYFQLIYHFFSGAEECRKNSLVGGTKKEEKK